MRFSSQECKMEGALSYWNWSENPMMTLFSTDGVLLEVRNRKVWYHAWSPVVMTSHVWTLSMLFFQDSTNTNSTLFVLSPAIWLDFVCMSPTLIKYTLAFCHHRSHLRHTVGAHTILYIQSSPPPAKQMKAISDNALELTLIPKFPHHGKNAIPQPNRARESYLLMWLLHLKKS
jgi:hypothetical protein